MHYNCAQLCSDLTYVMFIFVQCTFCTGSVFNIWYSSPPALSFSSLLMDLITVVANCADYRHSCWDRFVWLISEVGRRERCVTTVTYLCYLFFAMWYTSIHKAEPAEHSVCNINIIIIFINCNWVITWWQCLLYMSANLWKCLEQTWRWLIPNLRQEGYMRST